VQKREAGEVLRRFNLDPFAWHREEPPITIAPVPRRLTTAITSLGAAQWTAIAAVIGSLAAVAALFIAPKGQ
jgi:hypothetical protein